MTSKVTTYNHGVPWEEGNGVSQAYSVNGATYISGQFSHDMEGAFVDETKGVFLPVLGVIRS